MTKQEQQLISNKVNGLLGQGSLNWMGDFDMETKKEQFSVFFNKEAQAKKAILNLSNYGLVKLVKTPKFINTYFKYTVVVKLN